jgi:hypothetical protein
MITTTIENADLLTPDEFRALRAIANNRTASLDEQEGFLRVAFRGWFVYRGGHHVALHKPTGAAGAGGPRVLFLAEASALDEFDLSVTGLGESVVRIEPLTAAARGWLNEYAASAPWQWLGPALCVEHRYVAPLLGGAHEAGLRITAQQ